MVGFRNRLVHGYQRVTPERVCAIARDHLGDVTRFLEQVARLIEPPQGSERTGAGSG